MTMTPEQRKRFHNGSNQGQRTLSPLSVKDVE